MIKDQLEGRLILLKNELESGQKVLAELEAKQAGVRATMLRISGAIQVLEELLKQEELGKHEPQKVDEPLMRQEMTA
jgi:hypothetical protein